MIDRDLRVKFPTPNPTATNQNALYSPNPSVTAQNTTVTNQNIVHTSNPTAANWITFSKKMPLQPIGTQFTSLILHNSSPKRHSSQSECSSCLKYNCNQLDCISQFLNGNIADQITAPTQDAGGQTDEGKLGTRTNQISKKIKPQPTSSVTFT